MKPRILLILGIIFVLAICLGVGDNWTRKCKKLSSDWPTRCGTVINSMMPVFWNIANVLPNKTFSKTLSIYDQVGFGINYWDYLLGYDHPTTYLLLLQNDTEMRANGGFFGSYAVATLDKGQAEFRFEDIYTPDGQLDGHVEAPKPIEEAFRKGAFLLRDSDWDPDFVNSAKTIRWFFEKGGEVNPDLMMTISLSTIKKILNIVGAINIPDYDLTLSEDNIFSMLQAKVETDFFAGSTQKKDILNALGRAFIAKLEYLPLTKKLEVVQIIWDEVDHKNILVNSTNDSFQAKLEENQMAGVLKYPKCQDGEGKCMLDVYLAVESNLGANKANCCTDTQTTHKITKSLDLYKHDIQIEYKNKSIDENPKLPDFFGGNYIDYVRFYIPKNATKLVVTASPTLPTTLSYFPDPYTSGPARIDVNDYFLFKIIGFFHTTRAGTSSDIHISYELPITEQEYELHVLKQNGMQTSPQEIIFENQTMNTELEDDFVFSSVK